jgi:hypothetical protein
LSHAKKQRRKEERKQWNRIATAASSQMVISFSSQPKAYQHQIATLSREERNKWNLIARTASSRVAISFSSQPKAYQYQIATLSREESLTQRNKDAKKNANNGTGLR